MDKRQPEALAEFAESARKQPPSGKKDPKPQQATEHTTPLPESNSLKHDAATKVLREGATCEEQGADEAVEKTQDRIIESRD
jgi:hypothetical protein